MFKEKFERKYRQELESDRTAIRYFKAHPEYDRMKVADVDGKMKSLQERIETQEEALPSLQQSLQPYLQVQRYLRLATEPPSMVEQEEMQANGKQREPVREKPIHCEPEHRKKRSNDLSL